METIPAPEAAETAASIQSQSNAVSEVILNTGAERHPTSGVELLRSDAGDVRGDLVAMEGAGAEHVSAERVVMTNSGARTVEARSAQIDRSGILAARSEKAVFSRSSVIAAAVGEGRFVRGVVLALKCDRATFEGGARIGIYAGAPVDGMRPLVDARGAAAFGAGLGGVLVLLGAIVRRTIRRG
jgi:hypothetical protein